LRAVNSDSPSASGKSTFYCYALCSLRYALRLYKKNSLGYGNILTLNEYILKTDAANYKHGGTTT